MSGAGAPLPSPSAGAESTAGASAPTVLHVRSSGGLFGADRVVLDLCVGLIDRGVRAVLVALIEPDGSGEELVRAAGALSIPVERLSLTGSLDLGAGSRLAALARRYDADLLHGHDYKSDFCLSLARGSWRRVSTFHGWVGTSIGLRVKEGVGARLAHRFDRVVCVSEALARGERARGLKTLSVVHNGIDLRPFARPPASEESAALRRELGLRDGVLVVGAIGRLSEEKGYDQLLEALAQLDDGTPEHDVLLVGEGPERARLEAQARALGLDARLHLPGLRTDAPAIYPLIDVFCMPSRREGLPLALLEAMAAGCAVIVTPVGGIPEVVEDGESAVVAGRCDHAAWAGAIDALLGDAPRRRRLGENARARVEAGFSVERMTGSIVAVYHDVLATAGA